MGVWGSRAPSGWLGEDVLGVQGAVLGADALLRARLRGVCVRAPRTQAPAPIPTHPDPACCGRKVWPRSWGWRARGALEEPPGGGMRAHAGCDARRRGWLPGWMAGWLARGGWFCPPESECGCRLALHNPGRRETLPPPRPPLSAGLPASGRPQLSWDRWAGSRA